MSGIPSNVRVDLYDLPHKKYKRLKMKRISTASKESSSKVVDKRSVSNTKQRNQDINDCLNDRTQSKPLTPISDSQASEY